jgi:hypothetical protein
MLARARSHTQFGASISPGSAKKTLKTRHFLHSPMKMLWPNELWISTKRGEN